MKSLNRIAVFIMGVAFGIADTALAEHYHHAHRPPPPSDCITVDGLKDFCISPGCTIRRGADGFDLSCPNGLIGHFRLNDSHDL